MRKRASSGERADMPAAPENPELKQRMSLRGNLGLRDVKQVHELLSGAVNASRQIELDVREVSGMDISVIQLIAAARRSIEQRRGALVLVSEPNSAFAATLTRAGLIRADGAVRTADEGFWAGKLPAGESAS
jgi:anti-anti-sigma regulatory factor